MPPMIQSPQNAQLKQLHKLLHQRKHRRAQQQTVLEGFHLLEAYLNAGYLPKHVYVPVHRMQQNAYQTLLARLPQTHYTLVADTLLGKMSSLEHADDLITLIDLPHCKPLPQQGDCIILERVQDAGNVGTVLRSAAASGIQHIILSEGCADAFSPKVLRAGMGAHFLLNIHEQVDLLEWSQHYQHTILATTLTEQRPSCLYDLDLTTPNAWLFGNEGAGLSPALRQLAHTNVKIPMLGAIESLNIAQAATICLFEQMRQRLITI